MIQYNKIQYENDNSQKSTNLNSILRFFFMKIWLKMVINWDFSISNTLFHIIFPKHNLNFPPISLRNTRFHIVFPKQNLNFPPVSLRNTRFHIIFPKHNLDFPPVSLRNTLFHVVSLGKHKHKMVQWVWNGLKLIKEEKIDTFWYFFEIAPMVFCIAKVFDMSVLYRFNWY